MLSADNSQAALAYFVSSILISESATLAYCFQMLSMPMYQAHHQKGHLMHEFGMQSFNEWHIPQKDYFYLHS